VGVMRSTVAEIEIADLNEGLLSTVDAWTNKAHQVRKEYMMCTFLLLIAF